MAFLSMIIASHYAENRPFASSPAKQSSSRLDDVLFRDGVADDHPSDHSRRHDDPTMIAVMACSVFAATRKARRRDVSGESCGG